MNPATKNGEIEVGVTLHKGKPARLILLTSMIDGIEPASWDEVQAFAEKHNASAPSRIDGLVLWQRAAKQFKTDLPYWTCEESVGVRGYAWRQWFDDDIQNRCLKGTKARACLVRRVLI